MQASRALGVAIAALLVVLAPTVTSGRPPASDEVAADRDHDEGLLCYWVCMTACVLTGQRQDRCDAACTEMCFSLVDIPPGPTCEPEPVCE